jgi:hypothetical protein
VHFWVLQNETNEHTFTLGRLSVSMSSGCVAEKGWYPLTVRSVPDSFRSRPLGLLNPACSGLLGVFVMAVMAPDFRSFLATSRASRASAGRFGVCGVRSGSGRGAFNACNAFF